MANFKKYTPAELRALAQRLDEANDGIEAKRYGLSVKKVKIARNMKENADAMLSAFPNSKLADLVKDQVAAEPAAKSAPSNQMVPFVGKPTVYDAAVTEEPAEAAGSVAALTDGTTVVVPKGEAKVEEYTEEDEKATKLGTEIAKWKKKNAEAEVIPSIMAALGITDVTYASKGSGNKQRYVLLVTGDAYGTPLVLDNEITGKTSTPRVVNILQNGDEAIGKSEAQTMRLLKHITGLAKEFDKDSFPMKVTVGTKHERTMLLRHPDDKYGAQTQPPDVALIDWEPAPQQTGTGAQYRAFTISPSGKFGDAVINPEMLQLDNQLVAYVGDKELINEKVSVGLASLFLSKTFNKKKVKQADIVRFMELLDMFNYQITPHIEKTVKFAKLLDAIDDEAVDAPPEVSDAATLQTQLNRNISAMTAGNKSGQLARDTFDILDSLVKAKAISQERKDEYLMQISGLIGL